MARKHRNPKRNPHLSAAERMAVKVNTRLRNQRMLQRNHRFACEAITEWLAEEGED